MYILNLLRILFYFKSIKNKDKFSMDIIRVQYQGEWRIYGKNQEIDYGEYEKYYYIRFMFIFQIL